MAFNAWRRDDGSADANRLEVVAIGSYTGDGTASRTVSYATSGDRRPMWAIVVPSSGSGSVMRDPSHTGTTSTNAATGAANASTGITGGGVDQFSVGSALNASGVTYNYLVLIGGTGAGNNGWGQNGEVEIVDPNPGEDGGTPLCIPPFVCTAPNPETTSTPSTPTNTNPGDLTTDVASTCITSSTFLCNQALQELGITQQIANLLTEVTKEAQVFRLLYRTCIDQVLRDFPWPFATEYAQLTLVAGTSTTPVNNDWQYSYRAPSNMVFARRIAPPKNSGWKRGAFPAIPFRQGRDATGKLIYTDLALDATIAAPQLEYTLRVDCPAAEGDALFRQACIHRLAAAAAKPLERDAKDADRQMKLYLLQLNVAKTVHMNEGEHQDDQGPDADWIAGR